MLDALQASSAVKTGFLNSLEECELLIPGISRDKISDLTTNVIRGNLVTYTKQQCELLDVPTQMLPLGPQYDKGTGGWESRYFDLPMADGRPVLLVPKVIARYDPAYDHRKYYRDFVLTYLQAEHLDANSSLVHTLKKNNVKVVTKKAVAATFPLTKANLLSFSREHPEVLLQYRDYLKAIEVTGSGGIVEAEDERLIAATLSQALSSILPGSDDASTYHQLMVGVVEFLFFPALINPSKEREIHQGRKRIDIVMENGAFDGVFARMHQVRKLPSSFIVFECKNYLTEVANPELDQLTGRFSVNRGKFGMLCCRQFEDRDRFIERCRDTFRDDRGLVVPLDDETIIQWLSLIESGGREKLDERISGLVNEIWYS